MLNSGGLVLFVVLTTIWCEIIGQSNVFDVKLSYIKDAGCWPGTIVKYFVCLNVEGNFILTSKSLQVNTWTYK